jgi:hypothetical protein
MQASWWNLAEADLSEAVLADRGGCAETRVAADLATAYAAHPGRFGHHLPIPGSLPTAVWINPSKLLAASQDAVQTQPTRCPMIVDRFCLRHSGLT